MNSKQAQHDRTALPRIRELKAAGRSLREIADQLQHEGVPPPRRGGTWNHKAVDRILARAGRTPPEEVRPPAAPTETPAAQAEPLPTPVPQLQQIEDQLGSAVEQMGARLQNKLETVESQVDKRLNALNRLSVWQWWRPAAVGVAICLGVGLIAWVYTEAVAARIESQMKKLAALKSDIETQQATLRELEKTTWGVGFVEAAGSKYITWPGHYTQPFKGTGSNPTYAGKWVAKLAEE